MDLATSVRCRSNENLSKDRLRDHYYRDGIPSHSDCVPMTEEDAAILCKDREWECEINPFGLWAVGPRTEEGLLEVRGMGRNFKEAVEMANRT